MSAYEPPTTESLIAILRAMVEDIDNGVMLTPAHATVIDLVADRLELDQ